MISMHDRSRLELARDVARQSEDPSTKTGVELVEIDDHA